MGTQGYAPGGPSFRPGRGLCPTSPGSSACFLLARRLPQGVRGSGRDQYGPLAVASPLILYFLTPLISDPSQQDEWAAGDKGEGLTCLAWSPSSWDPTALLAGSVDGALRIWVHHEAQRKWLAAVSLIGHTGGVNTLAWAPNLGRSGHLIASAGKDKVIRLWRVEFVAAGEGGAPKVDAQPLATLPGHSAEIWRLQWNMTGTVLSSSGDDGVVRIWRANLRGEWKEQTQIAAEETLR